MIGLVDYDLQTSTSSRLTQPNLEIMKLATYYRVECNTFCRLIQLDETELSTYDKIYFFSEKDTLPQIPVQFLRQPGIIYGGTAFTNKVYVPFENEIIDYTLPKIEIYKEYLKDKYNNGIKSNIIEHILDDTYYRFYAGNNKLPLQAIRKNKRIFLYDRIFFQPDWENLIKEITNRKPSAIWSIHPIYCNTLNQYFTLRQNNKIARKNDFILELNIPTEDINYMLKKYKDLFLADILPFSQVYITLGNTFKTSFQYYKDFIYKLNLLYAFWSKNIRMKIKYIEPNIGTIDPLRNLSKIIETWSFNRTKDTATINDRIVFKTVKKPTIGQQQRDLLLKFHPEAKVLFNQTYADLSNRGYWRL